jgi:TRAP-type mannitol/chloroaromatic compound transport system substrate-binding protein
VEKNGGKTMADYVVKKGIQDFARENDLMVASDFYDELDKHVEKLLKAAARRTTANRRKTLSPHDL